MHYTYPSTPQCVSSPNSGTSYTCTVLYELNFNYKWNLNYLKSQIMTSFVFTTIKLRYDYELADLILTGTVPCVFVWLKVDLVYRMWILWMGFFVLKDTYLSCGMWLWLRVTLIYFIGWHLLFYPCCFSIHHIRLHPATCPCFSIFCFLCFSSSIGKKSQGNERFLSMILAFPGPVSGWTRYTGLSLCLFSVRMWTCSS